MEKKLEISVDEPEKYTPMPKAIKEVFINYEDGTSERYPANFKESKTPNVEGVYIWGYDGSDGIDVYRGEANPKVLALFILPSLKIYFRGPNQP